MQSDEVTVPISGRVSQRDYDFLMSQPFGGKVTASEKLRHVLSFFRNYHENLHSYGECITELERLLEEPQKKIREAERQHRTRSELVQHLQTTLPILLAELISADVPNDPAKQRAWLQDFEARLGDHMVALLEFYLRLGLTKQAPTYNPSLVRTKLATAAELIDLVRNNNQTKEASQP